MRQIYLDHCATTPIAPAAQEAMLPFLKEHYGDPGASHVLGRTTREVIEDARGRIALTLGADRDEILFTSGGTESNNLALLGTLLRRKNRGSHLVISAGEHESVSGPARWLEELGYEVSILPLTGQGLVTPATLRSALREDTALVSVQHANHEMGAIQPLRHLAEICHAQSVLLHTDAAQSIGKIRVQVQELDVDLLSLSGHKTYGPKGIGVLYVRHGVHLEPLCHGGGQEGGVRPGTENVVGIVGLGAALHLAAKNIDDAQSRQSQLRDRLLANLRVGSGESLVVHGELAPRLPHVLSIAFPDASASEILARLPELLATAGAVSTPGAEASSTLAAMGVHPEIIRGTLRLSLGWYTTETEVDLAASWLLHAWESVRL